jgi:hypothetical protein
MGQEEKTKAASEEQQGQSSPAIKIKNKLAIVRNSPRASDLFSRMLYAVREQWKRRNQGEKNERELKD